MKRLVSTILALAAMGLVASAAPAGPPLPGNYQSTDIGGTIPPGRYTEAWDPGGSAMSANTTLNCGSWDGANLGTVWRYSCGTELAPGVVIFNGVNASGNGNRTYMKQYVGGVFWLSGTGPWANGDADYPGVFESYVEYETVQYANWVPIAAITNVQTVAHFDNYPTVCMGFSIGNGTRVGTTDLGNVMPPNYPDLLDVACGATRTLGAWWDFTSITVTLTPDCATPVQTTTWGALKSLHR